MLNSVEIGGGGVEEAISPKVAVRLVQPIMHVSCASVEIVTKKVSVRVSVV
jgi:hypothetical protein